MFVTIKVSAGFRNYVKNIDHLLEDVSCEVSDGSTIRHVLEKMNFPQNVVSIILLNGNLATKDEVLKENDHIYLAMPMVGG
jgi:sulfur carrier protein ThiS